MVYYNYSLKPLNAQKQVLIHLLPNVVANVRHACHDECALRAMGKHFNLRSDGGDFGSKKCKRSYSWTLVQSDGVCV
jgi:hypothetical protein